MKKIVITVDVEHDCPPYLTSYRGIEEGLPRILELLERKKVRATFFVCADIAEKYPKIIEKISKRHEIGCHGYKHERLDKVSFKDGKKIVKKATVILRNFYNVTSFRAPNLKLPTRYLKLLSSLGYRIDSSLAKYKFAKVYSRENILRIPVSATSFIFHLPFCRRIVSMLSSPVILFLHPWEAIDMSKERIRWDCKFNTGKTVLKNLEEVLSMEAEFLTMEELLEK